MTQTTTPEPATSAKPVSSFDRYFGITALGSNIPRELPRRLHHLAHDELHPVRQPAGAVRRHRRAERVQPAADHDLPGGRFGSLAMGIVARYPFAQAPGMGLNAFFAYSVVGAMGYPWQTALGAVFVSGVLFVVLSVAGARQAIVKAIPLSLKFAITAGIGAFLAFLGFKSAGIVVVNEATLVGLGSLTHPTAWLAIIGLVGTAVLMHKKIKGAILYGIIGTSLIAIITRIPVYSGPDGTLVPFAGFANGIIGLPVWPTDLIGQLDIGAALGLGLFSVVFTFFFVDFFTPPAH